MSHVTESPERQPKVDTVDLGCPGAPPWNIHCRACKMIACASTIISSFLNGTENREKHKRQIGFSKPGEANKRLDDKINLQ